MGARDLFIGFILALALIALVGGGTVTAAGSGTITEAVQSFIASLMGLIQSVAQFVGPLMQSMVG